MITKKQKQEFWSSQVRRTMAGEKGPNPVVRKNISKISTTLSMIKKLEDQFQREVNTSRKQIRKLQNVRMSIRRMERTRQAMQQYRMKFREQLRQVQLSLTVGNILGQQE